MNADVLTALPPAESLDSGEATLSIRTADVVPEQVEWLWRENFALGKVAVVAGQAGAGKSLLVAGDFAARVSTGSPWPDGSPCPLGDVLIASGEDGAADTLVPRLVNHGADLKRAHALPRLVSSRDSCGDGRRWPARGGYVSHKCRSLISELKIAVTNCPNGLKIGPGGVKNQTSA